MTLTPAVNRRLEWLELTQVPPLAESLVEHINTFLRDYTTQWAAADPDLQPQVGVLLLLWWCP